MLGKLSRFMRIMGYDTLYPNLEIPDTELIKYAIDTNRKLISRDREICRRYRDSILIESDNLKMQIVQIATIDPPDQTKLFSRCTVCNGLLIPGNGGCNEEYDPKKKDQVTHCQDCGKCYWPGTHSESVLKFLQSLELYTEYNKQ